MARTSRSIAQLTEASWHLYYEYEMLTLAFKALQRIAALPTPPNEPLGERQAWVESFCIHARNLIQFLYASMRVDIDDILAIDFIEGWSPSRQQAPDMTLLHKKVAHLTWTRTTIPDDIPAHVPMFETVKEGIQEFLATVDQGKLHERWVAPPGTKVYCAAVGVVATANTASADMVTIVNVVTK